MQNWQRPATLWTIALLLATTLAAPAADWQLLFDGQTTHGWHTFKSKSPPADRWSVEDGWLHCLGKGGGDLLTDAQYDNFELQWEWKQAPVGNSGVKYFVLETRDEVIGHEYQMIDDERHADAKLSNGKHLTASFYDVLGPGAGLLGERELPILNPPGQTNQSRILVQGNHVEHWLNGAKVLEYECGSPELKSAIAKSKFKKTPGFGEKVKAHLLLQDHHTEAWFRNVKLRELPAPIK